MSGVFIGLWGLFTTLVTSPMALGSFVIVVLLLALPALIPPKRRR
jgi:hypothetical protein